MATYPEITQEDKEHKCDLNCEEVCDFCGALFCLDDEFSLSIRFGDDILDYCPKHSNGVINYEK